MSSAASPSAAVLALADGRCFWGRALGARGQAAGEVVFNTAMTGYQEILTDPSYCRQLVTLTCPHIGNVGCNRHDAESGRIQAAGLIIRDASKRASNWRSEEDLESYLQRHGTVAISELDTRALTRVLRDGGAQPGCIMSGPEVSAEAAIAIARATPDLKGQDLARVVTTTSAYDYSEGSHDLAIEAPRPAAARRFRVVAYDYGIKRNILRLLVDQGCEVHVVPARTSATEVLARKPDGVFLSNGPGDPEPCDYAIAAIRQFLQARLPIFGICLGHQLLGLALGGKTLKMKFGHHGANHPVLELASGRVLISSQNHGFAVDEASLPANARVTHRSLFDHSLQGLEAVDAPAFSFQGHPEGSPGPHDLRELFDRFAALMNAHRSGAHGSREPVAVG